MLTSEFWSKHAFVNCSLFSNYSYIKSLKNLFLLLGDYNLRANNTCAWLSRKVFLSLDGQARSTNYWCVCVCVCAGYVLGVVNLRSSPGRLWVSWHHCFIALGRVWRCMTLLLSRPAWFCGYANLLSWITINFQAFPIFSYLQSFSGINYLITYFVPLLCLYHQHSEK